MKLQIFWILYYILDISIKNYNILIKKLKKIYFKHLIIVILNYKMFYPIDDYKNSKKYVFEINANTYKYNGENELKNEEYAKYICDNFKILNIYEVFRYNKNSDEIQFLEDLKLEELKIIFTYKKNCAFCYQKSIEEDKKEETIIFKNGNSYNFNDLKEFSEYSYHKGFDIFMNIDCAKNYIFSLDIKNDIFPIQGEKISYFDNGSIQAKHNYLNGKYIGEQIRYYENGNVEDIENYINGINHGIFIHYYENGNLYSKTLYDMDKIIYKNECYSNKNLSEECNKDFEKSYYITGELYEHICFKTKIVKTYLKDGKLIYERGFTLVLQDYLNYDESNDESNYDKLNEEIKFDENYYPDLIATYDLVYTKTIYEIPNIEEYKIIHLNSFDEKYYENKKDYYKKINEYNKKKREEGKLYEQLIQIKV
jgi:antitoxin component YwqK of YwqJK toxin-antitoxin module